MLRLRLVERVEDVRDLAGWRPVQEAAGRAGGVADRVAPIVAGFRLALLQRQRGAAIRIARGAAAEVGEWHGLWRRQRQRLRWRSTGSRRLCRRAWAGGRAPWRRRQHRWHGRLEWRRWHIRRWRRGLGRRCGRPVGREGRRREASAHALARVVAVLRRLRLVERVEVEADLARRRGVQVAARRAGAVAERARPLVSCSRLALLHAEIGAAVRRARGAAAEVAERD